jgi:formate hydrogenlyase subunit 4
MQPMYDIVKLLRKGSVFSRTTSFVFRIGPSIYFASVLMAMAVVPVIGGKGLISFEGDFIFFAYVLALGKFFNIISALDTGSSFEGMGAAREVFFSALAEAAVFAVLVFLGIFSGGMNIGDMLLPEGISSWLDLTPVLLAALAMFLVLLTENCRLPFDDPETQLELTMIHEAMILDYSGPDLAAILYASSLKMWIFAGFVVHMLCPFAGMPPAMGILLNFGAVFAVAVIVGIVESSMARYRFLKVPPLLTAALVLPLLAILFRWFFDGGVK